MNAIDLWCERGIEHDEIIRRLSERSDNECLFACDWLKKWKILDDEMAALVAGAAVEEMNSAIICKQVEPRIRELMAKSAASEEVRALNIMMELQVVGYFEK